MKTGWTKIGALCLTLLFGSTVQAVTISLEDLVGGESITAGDKVFSDWVFDDSLGLEPDLANIQVTSLDDGDLDPGPGLSYDFGQELTLDSFADLDVSWGFTVTPADGLLIKDVSLSRGGFCSGCTDSGWAIIQDIYSPGGDLLGSLFDEWDWLDGVNHSDGVYSLDFAGQTSLWVETNVFLWTYGDEESHGLSSIEQRFSQELVTVPEPGTLALFGVGLLGIAASRRRRRH
jgi:hypothetical protein